MANKNRLEKFLSIPWREDHSALHYFKDNSRVTFEEYDKLPLILKILLVREKLSPHFAQVKNQIYKEKTLERKMSPKDARRIFLEVFEVDIIPNRDSKYFIQDMDRVWGFAERYINEPKLMTTVKRMYLRSFYYAILYTAKIAAKPKCYLVSRKVRGL